MPETKPNQIPEIKARRIRAYELFLSSKYSLREIALATGVTHQSVAYWRKKDEWDRRVQEAITQVGRDKANIEGNLKALIRAGLYEKLLLLRELGKPKPGKPTPDFKEQITAALAFVSACAKIKDIDPDLLDLDKEGEPVGRLEFKDELPEINNTKPHDVELQGIETWLGAESEISLGVAEEAQVVEGDSPSVESSEQSPSLLSPASLET